MEHTFEELKKKTVGQLRELAKEIDHEAVHGYSTMHKEDLVLALCTALDIEARVHHEVVGIDKTRVKARLRELKAERAAALEAGDRHKLKATLRRIHHQKRKLHKATV